MKFSAGLFAAFLAFVSSATAQEACTADVVQAKSQLVADAMQTIAAQNPDRMQELTAELQAQMDAIQSGGDVSTVCTFFDEVIAEAAG